MASLEAIRARVAELHLEQLLQREQPPSRTASSWQTILSGIQDACVAKLETLDTPQAVWDFAHRTLKADHLKEAFRFFAVDDVCEFSLTEQQQQDFIHPQEESASFDKDLELFEQSTSGVFDRSLRQAASDHSLIDLEPNTQFSASLKPGCGPIDLD